MNRLKLNRARKRDSIRYRLHTSIQAAAYLADGPGRDVIDRELEQIMQPARPKAPLDHDGEHVDCPFAERQAGASSRTSVVAFFARLLVATAVIGGVTALLVYLEGSRAFMTTGALAAAVEINIQTVAMLAGARGKARGPWRFLAAAVPGRRRSDPATSNSRQRATGTGTSTSGS